VAVLVWDDTGEKLYQAGISNGVLYLHDGRSVVWNGLVGMEESSVSDFKSLYLDGVKFLEILSPGDFSGKLKAWSYPEEFNEMIGIIDLADGLEYYEQKPKSFGLSYQTRIANDIDPNLGYKIHLLYNLLANSDTSAFDTYTKDSLTPTQFSWTLTGTPPKITGHRPTVHVSIDSTKTNPETLRLIEDQLYGTAVSDPSLPSFQQILEYFGFLGALIIVDYGDGTWAAIDESNDYITMLNDTTFQIDHADVVYLDAVTYEISSTNVS
jgi:hypothetical protein